MGALPQTLRDPITPLVRIKGSPPLTNDRIRSPTMGDGEKERDTKNGMYPGCLAHVVSGMFHSFVANRRQPSLFI